MARELELSPIRDGFRDEAGDSVEVEDDELVRASLSVSASSSESAETEPARPGPHARHRFTPGTSDTAPPAKAAHRVVVLRDLRRASRGPRSSDVADAATEARSLREPQDGYSR